MRIVIVDDEPNARGYLAELLEGEPDVSIVASCGDGGEAVAAALEHAPDVVFLDVEMPGCDGLEAARRLFHVAPDVRVVFVTAYDSYAVRAFEVHAVDYLLKPFDRARLVQTLDRLRALEPRDRADHRPAASALDEVRRARGAGGYLVSHTRGNLRLVPTDEVLHCVAEGNYVRVHTADENVLVRTSLTKLEADLDPERYARVSRSALVRVDQIRGLEPLGHGDYQLELRDGTTVGMSRRYRARLEEILGRSL